MKKYYQIILLILLAFSFASSFSQTNNEPAVIADSTNISIIPLEDIPIAAGETSAKILRLAESSLSLEQLEEETARNESMFSNVDSLITIENSSDFSTLGARYLLARINYWNDYKKKIESQKEHLAQIVKKLKDDKKIMDEDAARWRNTQTRMDATTANPAITSIINDVIVLADSNSANALAKINQVIPLLNAEIGRAHV